MATTMRFLSFLPGDEVDVLAAGGIAMRTNTNDLHALLRLDAKQLSEVACSDELRDFVRSYLKNRSRFYDGGGAVPEDVTALDGAVLHLLVKLSSTAHTSGKGMASAVVLDAVASFDLASLYGPSNATVVSDILRKSFESSAPLMSGTASALQSIADVLTKDIPKGLGSATSVDELSAYLTDVIHSVSRLLTLSPHACYGLMPAKAVHDGAGLLGQKSLLAAIVATYENTLPCLAAKLMEAGAVATLPGLATETPLQPLQLKRLQVSCHSALRACQAILDTCYVDVMRMGKASASLIKSSGSVSYRTAARADPQLVALAFYSVLTSLASFEPEDPLASVPSLAAGAAARKSSNGGFFFRDLCRVFNLRDVLQPVLGTAASAGFLDDNQRSFIMRIVTDAESGGRSKAAFAAAGIGPAGGGSGRVSQAQLASVLEILPEASPAAVERALAATGGDVAAAVEKLLTSAGNEASASSRSNAASNNNNNVRRGAAVDDDLRARTLALKERQDFEDEESRRRAAGSYAYPSAAGASNYSSSAAKKAVVCAPKLDSDGGRGDSGGDGIGARGGQSGLSFDRFASQSNAAGGSSASRMNEDGEYEANDDEFAVLDEDAANEHEYDDEYDDGYDDVEHLDLPDGGAVGAETRMLSVEGRGRMAAGSAATTARQPRSNAAGASTRDAEYDDEAEGDDFDDEVEDALAGPAVGADGLLPAGPGFGRKYGNGPRDEDEKPYDDGLANYKPGPGAGAGGGEDAGRGGRGRGRGRGGSRGGAALPRDVTGHGPRAKGGLTERDATFRRENKARFGNHNRRRGADKKMARAGAFPPAL